MLSARRKYGWKDVVFSVLEKAALEGARCPTNLQIASELRKRGGNFAGQSMPAIVKALATQGDLTVEIYGGNWRRVILASGANAGKATAPPPHGGKPFIILNKSGLHRRYSSNV